MMNNSNKQKVHRVGMTFTVGKNLSAEAYLPRLKTQKKGEQNERKPCV